MKYLASLINTILICTVMYGQNTLQYNLKKGDVYTVKQNAQQTITQELDGAAHEITNKINSVLEFTVIEQSEDRYTLELVFKDVNLITTSNLQGELINVKAKEVDDDDPQSKIFNSLLNTPIEITLAKDGNILEVKGGDSLVEKMAQASGLQDEFSLNVMRKSLEREFGSEALSHSYEQMTYIYPKTKLKVGDTWKNEFSGKLSAKNNWTLEGLTAENATIKGKADVVMDIKEPTTTMKLSGKQETTILTDLASGFILKMTVEGLSKGFSTMTQMEGQEIPTTIKSSTTYELINL